MSKNGKTPKEYKQIAVTDNTAVTEVVSSVDFIAEQEVSNFMARTKPAYIVITPEIAESVLQFATRVGDTTDEELASFAGVSRQALYNYRKNNPRFEERLQALKKAVNIKAKMNIGRNIMAGDTDTSIRFLEKTDKAFNPKVVTESLSLTGSISELFELAERRKQEAVLSNNNNGNITIIDAEAL